MNLSSNNETLGWDLDVSEVQTIDLRTQNKNYIARVWNESNKDICEEWVGQFTLLYESVMDNERKLPYWKDATHLLNGCTLAWYLYEEYREITRLILSLEWDMLDKFNARAKDKWNNWREDKWNNWILKIEILKEYFNVEEEVNKSL